jgi:tetratricopeptide (TPR) repeat protein
LAVSHEGASHPHNLATIASDRARIPLPGRRGAIWFGLAALIAVTAALCAIWWYRVELRRVELELKSGRHHSARARLSRLAMLGLKNNELDYWRGVCEEAEGRVDEALATWGQIHPGSPRFANAVLRRARLAIDQGRFALAEETLADVSFPVGSEACELHEIMMQQVYLFTGRSAELRRRKQKEWAGTRNKADVLRKHWQIDEIRSFPMGALRFRLEEAGRTAPDDDRVWLGRANLALCTARFGEANEWVEKCLSRRPEDPAVWRARLEWAMSLDRVPEAIHAMDHIPIKEIGPERFLKIRAWLAARRNDEPAERAALAKLLELVPGETEALARLTELAVRSGRTQEAVKLRRQQKEIDQATEKYRKLLNAGVPTSQYDELGRLAETLGRWFEARGWWQLAGRDTSNADRVRDALRRLAELEKVQSKVGRDVLTSRASIGHVPSRMQPTVADVLADLISPKEDGRVSVSQSLVIPQFRDDAPKVGLRFVYENDPTPMCRMPETMGGGVGVLDYDGDGWLDVYAVQGGMLSNESAPASLPQGDRLFHNRGDGTFEDATVASKIAAMPGGYGHGVAVGDYDNDRRPDLFITRWRAYALYHNEGNGTFKDVTLEAGLGGRRDWPTSAAFADLDNDGDLDLYVCHYSAWDPVQSPPCPHPSRSGKYSYCGPRTFPSMPDHVFRNDNGRFHDVSVETGVLEADTEGRGLGVVAADFDGDGKIDLFVANDLTANFLFRNRGAFRFTEMAAESGVAANAEGGYLAGMGIACGDFNGDGRIDLAVTNFYAESTTYYQNLGAGQFVDHTAAIGLAAPSRFLLGFGAAFLDANNDGRLDLATANGHVNDLGPHVPYTMPAQLLLGQPDGRVVDVSRDAGPPWQVLRLGRGLAVGDLDNDGQLDVLIVAEGGPLAYFHNQGPAGHFITFKLEGSAPGSNCDAVGARLTLSVAGHKQVAYRVGGGSFLSASDDRVHFGLGAATDIDAVEVRWPSGHVDRYTNLTADAAYILREGQKKAGRIWIRRRHTQAP